MGRHHDPATLPIRSHRHKRAVVERAHQVTFRATELLIGRQVQAALDLGPIQHGIVFASCHERKACQISKDGSHTIEPIQPHQGTFLRELVRLQIALNGGHCPTQFLPVLTVP